MCVNVFGVSKLCPGVSFYNPIEGNHSIPSPNPPPPPPSDEERKGETRCFAGKEAKTTAKNPAQHPHHHHRPPSYPTTTTTTTTTTNHR